MINPLPDCHGPYLDGFIWRDVFSFKKEDEKYDFYMMLGKWTFMGRFESFIDAMAGPAEGIY